MKKVVSFLAFAFAGMVAGTVSAQPIAPKFDRGQYEYNYCVKMKRFNEAIEVGYPVPWQKKQFIKREAAQCRKVEKAYAEYLKKYAPSGILVTIAKDPGIF